MHFLPEAMNSPKPIRAWQPKLAWQVPHEPQPMVILPEPKQRFAREPPEKMPKMPKTELKIEPNLDAEPEPELAQTTYEAREVCDPPVPEGEYSAVREIEADAEFDESSADAVDHCSVSRIDIRVMSPETPEAGLNIIDILSHNTKEDCMVELVKKFPSLSKNAKMLLRLEKESEKKYSTNGLKRKAVKTLKLHTKCKKSQLPGAPKESLKKSSIVTVKYGISVNPKKRRCQPDLFYRLPKHMEASPEHSLVDCDCRKSPLPIKLTVNGQQVPIQSRMQCF